MNDAGDEDLGREAERIERLLEDLHTVTGGPVWQRVNELVHRLVRLYGAGLAHLLSHLGDLERLDDALADRLAGDPLLSSLLLLHDLHPWPLAERIQRALDRARPELEGHVGPFSVEAVQGEAVVVKLAGQSPVAASTLLSVERLFARALQDVAPEITRVDIQGLRRPAAPAGPALVQIDLARTRSGPPAKANP
jgi:hypothetical protein